jgi:rhomboid protease GluP
MSLFTRLRDPLDRRGVPLLPPLLGVACVVLYALTVRLTAATELEAGLKPSGLALVRYGALFGPFFHQGEWWRALTAIFLHGDLLHLLMNGLGLWAVVTVAEQRYGAACAFVLFVVTGTAGEVASGLWNPRVLSVGASGGIFGLIGLGIAYAVKRHDTQLWERFTSWVILGVIMGFAYSGRIDNAAHLGGLLSGGLLGVVVGDNRSRRVPGWVWPALAAVCLVATLGAFALAARSPLPDLVR